MNSDKAVRRLKTYTSSQGYVYQYYFVGKRAALASDAEAPATEFVFDVTSDRKLTYAVSVFLPGKSVSAWAPHTSVNSPKRSSMPPQNSACSAPLTNWKT